MKTVELDISEAMDLLDADLMPSELHQAVDEAVLALNKSTTPDDHITIQIKITK